jgi:Carbohydrate esterase, sialic acid-specific acetylesterase
MLGVRVGLAAGMAIGCADPGGRPLCFVFTGESNSGGTALNTAAIAAELAPRSRVQILTTVTHEFDPELPLVFQPLDIGTNNFLDHDGLTSSSTIHPAPGVYTTHGMELALSNAVDAGAFRDFGNGMIHLVKVGQGGWSIPFWGAPGTPWQRFLVRTSAARGLLPGNTQYIVWYSQGINDAIQAGDTAHINTWVASTVAVLERIQAQIPGCLIFMTEFASIPRMSGSPIDDAISSVVSQMSGVYAVNLGGIVSGENDGDAHWTYSGFKNTVVPAMVAATLDAL